MTPIIPVFVNSFLQQQVIRFSDLLHRICGPEILVGDGFYFLFLEKLKCFQKYAEGPKKCIHSCFFSWLIFAGSDGMPFSFASAVPGKFLIPDLEPPRTGLSNQCILWS